MIERPDRYDLQIQGFTVDRCIVDFAFSLVFVKDREDATIRIEGPFACVLGGKHYQFNPEREPDHYGPALALVRRRVESASISKAGILQVMFADLGMLTAPPSPHYESWTINFGDLLIVGGPEKLSIFGPQERRSG